MLQTKYDCLLDWIDCIDKVLNGKLKQLEYSLGSKQESEPSSIFPLHLLFNLPKAQSKFGRVVIYGNTRTFVKNDLCNVGTCLACVCN